MTAISILLLFLGSMLAFLATVFHDASRPPVGVALEYLLSVVALGTAFFNLT